MTGIFDPTKRIVPPPTTGLAGSPMNIAPLGVLLWDNKEVSPGETTIIDTWGFTYVTLFVEVDRPASLTLAEVSRDGVNWRSVGGFILAFDTPGSAFMALHEVVEAKEVLLYRFLKIRVDCEAPIRITLEATSKLLDLLSVLNRIAKPLAPGRIPGVTVRPGVKVSVKPPGAEVVVKPPEVVVKPEFKPLFDELQEIHELLELRFTNPNTWDHDQKNVTTPGTPVQLPALAVPDGYELVVQAKTDNTEDVYAGNAKDTTSNSTKRKRLEPSDAFSLKVKNASAVWIDADNSGDGVEYWCEKRS